MDTLRQICMRAVLKAIISSRILITQTMWPPKKVCTSSISNTKGSQWFLSRHFSYNRLTKEATSSCSSTAVSTCLDGLIVLCSVLSLRLSHASSNSLQLLMIQLYLFVNLQLLFFAFSIACIFFRYSRQAALYCFLSSLFVGLFQTGG